MPSDHNDDRPFWHNRGSYDLNSRIMMTAIVSLAAVIVFVITLHIYARCVLRRQAQRQARAVQLGHRPAQVVNSGEPIKTGLDPSIIASLPILVFKQADYTNEENTTMECAVCLSMFKEAEMVRLLPNCKHTFHAECIDKWLSSHSTCPICRAEAEPRVQPEAQEAANGAPPTAPPLERVNPSVMSSEGTSAGASQSSDKVGVSGSRLSSFRRMLSREKSSRRIQYRGQEDGIEDLERQ